MRLAIALACVLPLAHGADSGAALAGHWKGQGHIVDNWTTRHELAMDLQVTSDGAVSGSVGDAEIVSGHVESGSVVKMTLRGPLLRDDGVVRKEFQLHVTRSGTTLTGFGSSDGDKSWPGASRASRLRSMWVQITRVVLDRVP